mmetsp:Transcript_17329/g.40382  ORF Transcript_17329/g.40382 Transcript_17329/m.40382 type:complete len:630 (-) Transcript_17329:62-1951(-)
MTMVTSAGRRSATSLRVLLLGVGVFAATWSNVFVGTFWAQPAPAQRTATALNAHPRTQLNQAERDDVSGKINIELPNEWMVEVPPVAQDARIVGLKQQLRTQSVPSRSTIIDLQRLWKRGGGSVAGVSSLAGKWRMQVDTELAAQRPRGRDFSRFVFDLYTSPIGKALAMKLDCSPTLEITRSGSARFGVRLQWGPNSDEVTVESRLRMSADGAIQEVQRQTKSQALGSLTFLPLLRDRLVEVSYLDDELLILQDASSNVFDVFWKKEAQASKPSRGFLDSFADAIDTSVVPEEEVEELESEVIEVTELGLPAGPRLGDYAQSLLEDYARPNRSMDRSYVRSLLTTAQKAMVAEIKRNETLLADTRKEIFRLRQVLIKQEERVAQRSKMHDNAKLSVQSLQKQKKMLDRMLEEVSMKISEQVMTSQKAMADANQHKRAMQNEELKMQGKKSKLQETEMKQDMLRKQIRLLERELSEISMADRKQRDATWKAVVESQKQLDESGKLAKQLQRDIIGCRQRQHHMANGAQNFERRVVDEKEMLDSLTMERDVLAKRIESHNTEAKEESSSEWEVAKRVAFATQRLQNLEAGLEDKMEKSDSLIESRREGRRAVRQLSRLNKRWRRRLFGLF